MSMPVPAGNLPCYGCVPSSNVGALQSPPLGAKAPQVQLAAAVMWTGLRADLNLACALRPLAHLRALPRPTQSCLPASSRTSARTAPLPSSLRACTSSRRRAASGRWTGRTQPCGARWAARAHARARVRIHVGKWVHVCVTA